MGYRTGLRSKRKVRFAEDQPEGDAQGAREGERPSSEGTPDQTAAAEGAKRQRQEEEDANQRESENTGGSSGSGDQPGADREDEFEEGRSPNALTVPEGPSQREREEHSLTHIPYRDWCEHCVRARARRRAHRRRDKQIKKEELQRVTRIYMDFFYNGIGEAEEELEEANETLR